MTQIEVTDGDIAEAKSLIDSFDGPDEAVQGIAQTIAKLRVATAFLTEAIDLIKSGKAYDQMCCSGYECGCMGATNDQHFLHFAEPALAQITQEIPE